LVAPLSSSASSSLLVWLFCFLLQVLRKPKFDLQKLMEVHDGGAAGAAATVEEPALVETLEGTGGRL
jgi:hypothetical protein